MKVMYLYHSGVLIENDEVQIFIDSYKDISEIVNPKKRVYMLASHGHSDHWSNDNLRYCASNVTFVLSRDIVENSSFLAKIKTYNESFNWDKLVCVQPYDHYKLRDLKITTYGSTDLGVAFVIEIDEKVIYHSGDLNWWHWENDSKEAQLKEASDYKSELKKIKFNKFDLAFVPLDPRLNKSCYLAIDYLLEQFSVDVLVPIHFGDRYLITKSLSDRYQEKKVKLVTINQANVVIDL